VAGTCSASFDGPGLLREEKELFYAAVGKVNPRK